MPSLPPEDEYDEAEAARRRDEVVKRMLATPPQPRLQPVRKGQKKAAATDEDKKGA